MQARFGPEKVAQTIERFFGELAARLVNDGTTRIVVGGGETAGAVVGALGVEQFRIGPEIDPGVPVLAVEGRPLRMALKSGNFGSVDFFDKALHALGDDD
jgi:3-dehydrotetronate 4-kinase